MFARFYHTESCFSSPIRLALRVIIAPVSLPTPVPSSRCPDPISGCLPLACSACTHRLSLRERCFCPGSVSCHRCKSCRGLSVPWRPGPRSFSSVRGELRTPRTCTACHSRGTPVSFCSAGGRVKTWKRRWFILTDNCLYYFEYTTVSPAGWPWDRKWARPPSRNPCQTWLEKAVGPVGRQSDLSFCIVGGGRRVQGRRES